MKSNQVSGLRKAVITGVMGLAGLVSSAALPGCSGDFSNFHMSPIMSQRSPYESQLPKNTRYDKAFKMNKKERKEYLAILGMSINERQGYLTIFEKNPERYEEHFKHYYDLNKKEEITSDDKIHMVLMRLMREQ